MRDFRTGWKSLVLTDITYKIIAFVILTPLAGLFFRAFLSVSGNRVLADQDILFFFLKPVGWICLIAVGAVSITILALEQAALLGLLGSLHGRQRPGVIDALRFAGAHGWPVLRVTARVVGITILVLVPFLVGAGLVYGSLLTEFDINYYLQEKPPVFWVAIAIGGVLGALLVGVIFRLLTDWFFALPLVIFERVLPADALRASSGRAAGHRIVILRWVVGWLLATCVLSAVTTVVVVWLAQSVIPRATGSLPLLSVAIGVMLILWFGGGVFVNLLGTTAFATLLFHLYVAYGTTLDIAQMQLETATTATGVKRPELTRMRLISGVLIAGLLAGLIGVGALHTLRWEDRVQIMAHRGSSAAAPENTLASVKQAIVDRADFVEIDVQETADGQVVVFHDSDFKKLAGIDLKIWDATLRDLQRIDIGSSFSPKFSDQRVPTLAQVLETCKGKIRVNIELKYYGHDQQLEQRVVDIVEAHGMTANIVAMSLKLDAVQKMKALRPDWKVGLLMSVSAGAIRRVDADFFAVNAAFVDSHFIQRAHDADKEVYVWTVNDAPSMSLMISHGVDGIITDKPALARKVLEQRARMSVPQRLLLELASVLGLAPGFAEQ